jgi:hypothetical protein
MTRGRAVALVKKISSLLRMDVPDDDKARCVLPMVKEVLVGCRTGSIYVIKSNDAGVSSSDISLTTLTSE